MKRTYYYLLAGQYEQYFRLNSDLIGDCWLWNRCKSKLGYGHAKFKGKHWTAHRLAYTLLKGPIPKGKIVCHSCDNPACVNPAHLWLGTHKENTRNAIAKGRLNPGKTAKDTFKRLGYWPMHRDNHAGTRKSRKRKLSYDDVIAIRSSDKPLKELSNKYGVSMACISFVRNGRRKNK